MDRRRFYITSSLTENLSSDPRRSLFEDVMSELNKLYEEDENPATAEPVETETPAEASAADAKEVLAELKDSDYVEFVKVF